MNAQDLTRASEGLRLHAYDDATGDPVPAGGSCAGTLTIGRGHTGPDVVPGMVCTEAEADAWFDAQHGAAERQAAVDLGTSYWADLDEIRRAALNDMAFQMGGGGLKGFQFMLAAIRTRNWQRAHDEALASAWARQTPRRADRNALMLLTGQWPAQAA